MLFENSIVCHVFYAIALGAARDFGCVWFLGFVLFWFAWSSFRFVVGVGLGFGLVFWAVVLTLGSGWLFVVGWGLFLLVLFGEFDPGSGRTLAACLTHASRTVKRLPFWWVWMSGERVSNT